MTQDSQTPSAPEEPKVDVHKPKPAHNWREFLTEIGTIVIGVAIALIAEQAVEWLHWQHRIADTRASILLELRDDDAPQAFTRVAAAGCFEKQLDVLQDAIEAGRPRAQIMALVQDYRIPVRTWDMISWNAMLASGVTAHIAPEQLYHLSTPFARIPILSQVSEDEGKNWLALRPVRRSGDNLAPAEADTMLEVVSRLRGNNRFFGVYSKGLLAELKDQGIEVPQQEQRQILAELKAHLHDCVITPVIPVGDPADNSQTNFFTPMSVK